MSTAGPPSSSMYTDGRERLSRGSVDPQTAQRQPIMGTPCDVPVPRKVIRTKVGTVRRARRCQGTMMREAGLVAST